MAEYVVELPELEVACDFFLDAEYPYFEELREAFLVMKYCGCRPMELFDISRWTHVVNWEFQMQPQKNNLIRSITLGIGCESFRTCVINQITPFLGRTYSQLQGIFYKLCPWRPLFSGGREITLYVYRYFFVKSLIADGLTYAQVATLMGHRTETPVYLYANAVLTSTYEIPVIPSDPYPAEHIDIYLQPRIFTGVGDSDSFNNPITTSIYSVWVKMAYPVGSIATVLNSYQYNIDEKTLYLPFNVNTNRSYPSLNCISSYNAPLQNNLILAPDRLVHSFVWLVSESFIVKSGWHYGSVTIKGYLDGVFISQTYNTNSYFGINRAAKINVNGRRHSTGSYQNQTPFTLDKLMIWNRELSLAEIQSLTNL